MKTSYATLRWAAFSLISFAPVDTYAQDVASFYSGKVITLVVGFPTGGGSDVYGRILSQHLGKHIPGNPRVVMQNMPGAGSIVAANFMYNNAARDGTVIGGVSQGQPLEAKLRNPQIRFDAGKFNWIGRTSPTTHVTMVRKDSRARTLEDVYTREMTLAATGAGSTISVFPSVMNKVLGTKFKIVMGYKGSADSMLAMERGETEGHSTSWELLKAIHPDWITTGSVRFLVQHGTTRHPELPDLPTSVEAAKTELDRAVMQVVMGVSEVGHSYFAPPEVPPERVAVLRQAFNATMKDPGYVHDVKAINGEIHPLTGLELQKIISDLDSIPPPIIDRVRSVYSGE